MDEPTRESTRRSSPRLSVVVPVYDVEKYLSECIDSILAQTLRDLEVVIVNDRSPDGSEAIILAYQARDDRIRYVSHSENLGLGGARNTGIRHATGEWITFVDSDDYVEAGCYEAALALIDRHSADGAVFPIVSFDDATGKEDQTGFPFNAPFANPTRFDSGMSYFHTVGPTVCNKLFRTSDLTANGIGFPEHLKHEDEEFSFKYVAKVAPRLVHEPSHRYHYRQRDGSIMRSHSSRLDLSKVLVNVFEFLQAEQLVDQHRTELVFKAREYLGYIARAGIVDTLTPAFVDDLRYVVDHLALSVEELDALPAYFLAIFITDGNARRSFLGRNLVRSPTAERDELERIGRLPRRRRLPALLRRVLEAARRIVCRPGS